MKKKVTDITPAGVLPSICFSRKIGIGALEIADILAEMIGYRVVDRQIIEHIADYAVLRKKTVAFFDERYPGKMTELATLLFGEKSFVMHDYMRKLFSTVFVLAETGPTVFVGRGTHLILPRDQVLAVRLISSREFRINRLADILNVTVSVAEKKIDAADNEQQEFFKKAYRKKDAPAHEFDLIINCDFINRPGWAAEIVRQAFVGKFPAAACDLAQEKEVA
jgi:cytidylate kinase